MRVFADQLVVRPVWLLSSGPVGERAFVRAWQSPLAFHRRHVR